MFSRKTFKSFLMWSLFSLPRKFAFSLLLKPDRKPPGFQCQAFIGPFRPALLTKKHTVKNALDLLPGSQRPWPQDPRNKKLCYDCVISQAILSLYYCISFL